MHIYIIVLCNMLSAMLNFLSTESQDKALRKTCPDLYIESMTKPDWDQSKKITTIHVVIKNKGNYPSDTTAVKMEDEDVDGYSDALTSKATILQYGNKKELIKEFTDTIPPILPGESKEMVYRFNYWVYDPDCELKFTIDPRHKMQECRTDNNVATFRERAHK